MIAICIIGACFGKGMYRGFFWTKVHGPRPMVKRKPQPQPNPQPIILSIELSICITPADPTYLLFFHYRTVLLKTLALLPPAPLSAYRSRSETHYYPVHNLPTVPTVFG